MTEGVIGIKDLVEFEVMSDELSRIDLAGLHSLQQHRRRHGIDQARRNRDVL